MTYRALHELASQVDPDVRREESNRKATIMERAMAKFVMNTSGRANPFDSK